VYITVPGLILFIMHGVRTGVERYQLKMSISRKQCLLLFFKKFVFLKAVWVV